MRLPILHEMRAWIDHWDEDRRSGLTPTEGSLAEARRQIDRAIRAEERAPRRAVPIVAEIVDREPVGAAA